MSEMTAVDLPTVVVGGKCILHNGVKWRVATNRHPNTDRTRWGWIEGAPGNVCWSDNAVFNARAAGEAVLIHNEWLEDQKPLSIQLIEATERRDAAHKELHRAKQTLDLAQLKFDACEIKVIALSNRMGAQP